MYKLNEMESDALKEIANIGGGNASTALSQMLGQNVKVFVPYVEVVSVEKMPDLMGDAQNLVTMVLLKIVGDIPGTMMLLFTPKDALKLANLLTHRTKAGEGLDELDRSALKEVGNILSGAAINSLSTFLGITLLQSIPDTATDMLRAVVQAAAVEFGQQSEEVLVMKSSFSIAGNSVAGDIYLMFDPKASQAIITALHEKFN